MDHSPTPWKCTRCASRLHARMGTCTGAAQKQEEQEEQEEQEQEQEEQEEQEQEQEQEQEEQKEAKQGPPPSLQSSPL